MVLTDTDELGDIDEALTYLSADIAVARACGDTTRHLYLVEEVDRVLEHRHELYAQKNPGTRQCS